MSQSNTLGGLPPPPGVVPNFINPESRQGQTVATLSLCLALTSTFVAIRLYAVFFILKSHRWPDYCSFLSWIGFIAYCSLTFVVNKYGFGIHQWDVPRTHLERFSQIANDLQIMYGPLLFCIKLSILLQFKQLFCPSGRNTTWYLIQALIWSNLIFYVADTCAEIWECIPRSKIWDPTAPGHCVNINAAFIATASVNVVSDILMLALPICNVWNLQMSVKRKVAISGVFLVGGCMCAASAIRLGYSVAGLDDPDQTWSLLPTSLWIIAELACGIICGCLPTCPTFFQVVYSKLRPKEGRNIYSRDRMSKVGRFKSTLGSGSHSRGLRRWDRPFGSTAALNNDQYLELGQRYATPEHQIAVQQRGQEENLAMPNAIRKTVRLEQSAQ